MTTLLCVTLTPSLDRYSRLPSLRVGGINRPAEVEIRAGGKGFNVARAARGLGVPTRVVAVVGGPTGAAVKAHAAGFTVSWVDSGGADTRQCLCLLDESTGALTEVYEPPRAVPATRWPDIHAAVAAALDGAGLVALSGRVPPGLPETALADLVRLATVRGVPVVVDADGPALVAALPHGPDLVKVNDDEAARAAGVAGGWAAAAALRARGARSVVVTAGPEGARYVAHDGRRLSITHPPVPDALPVGSGDAFLAAFAAARLGHGPSPAGDLPGALRFAAAAARANARHFTAGDLTTESVRAELPAVRCAPA